MNKNKNFYFFTKIILKIFLSKVIKNEKFLRKIRQAK